jgi:hypothetical protein
MANDLNVGSRVCVAAESMSGQPTPGEFRVMERYQIEGREPMYRLLSTRERTERMVPESELRRPRLHLSPGVRHTGVS